MRFRAHWRFAVPAVLVVAGFARAEVKEVAELLPAQTLAVVEVRQPERLAREVAELLKNSDLDDMAAAMARYRERVGDNGSLWAFNDYAGYAVLFSPEVVNECGRIQGAGLAVTGVNKDGPEVALVVLAGDSNLPTFVMRVWQSGFVAGHSVGEVEGVHIYRQRSEVFQPAAPGQPQPPKWEDSGPFLAMAGPCVVFGSSLDGVKDVIRRFKGKSTEPSLADVAAYKEAVRQRDKPGLFGYADQASLAQRLDEMGANLGWFEPQWRFIKAVVNPKAVHGATASLTLVNGTIELKARVDLDPKEGSPLADVVAAKSIQPDALWFTPRDGSLTLQLNLDNGEKRWQRFLDLMDAVYKPARGEPDRTPPSELVKAAEGRIKLGIAKDVMSRLVSAAVVVEPAAAMTGKGRPFPLIVLQATDADAAKYLESEGLPKLIGVASLLRLGGGEAPAAVREDVDGRSIVVVAAGGLVVDLGVKNLYIGREGAFVAIGCDGKDVIAALDAGAKKQGLLGDDKTAAAIKALDNPQALAVASLNKSIVEWFRQRELAPVNPQPFAPAPPLQPGDKPPMEPAKLSQRAEQTIADVGKALQPLSPAVVGVSRKPDALMVEARITGLKGVTNKVIDLWIESGMERIVEATKGTGN